YALEVVRPSLVAKKLALVFNPREASLVLVADAERIQQVVWNLLSNAIKFTPTGGTVSLEISRVGSNAVLSVADSGKGIEPDFLPHSCGRSKQAVSSTPRRVGGLGLGLALVRHITELHGGEVAASSAGLGQGSTFTVTLPIRAVTDAAGGAAPAPASQAT